MLFSCLWKSVMFDYYLKPLMVMWSSSDIAWLNYRTQFAGQACSKSVFQMSEIHKIVV
jgi:hypothetical protein